jgi:hypothetical protein
MQIDARTPCPACGKVLTYGLNKGAKGYEVTALDSLCGGRVTLSLEVLIPMPHVLLIGGGHCAQAIAPALDALGWDHSVHDTRADFCDAATFPNARHHLHMDAPTFVNTQKSDELSKYSDVLLLGHDWSEDQLRLLGMLSTLQSQAVRLDGQTAHGSALLAAARSGKRLRRQRSKKEFLKACSTKSSARLAFQSVLNRRKKSPLLS